MSRYLKNLFMAATVAALVGCGGGGSSNSSTDVTDFSGTWSGTYNGQEFRFVFTQSGSNLAATRTIPAQIVGSSYSGVISANVALLTTYQGGVSAGATSWTKVDSTNLSSVVTSCTPPPGFTCGAVGTVVAFKKL